MLGGSFCSPGGAMGTTGRSCQTESHAGGPSRPLFFWRVPRLLRFSCRLTGRRRCTERIMRIPLLAASCFCSQSSATA
jgi:hypothetical protein